MTDDKFLVSLHQMFLYLTTIQRPNSTLVNIPIAFTSYNLQIIEHMDVISIVSDDLIITFTSYNLQIMGHMDVISIVSDGFNIYFPIAIVLLCICTYFSLGSRILHFLGFQQFIGDDDMTQEFVDEGKSIISRGMTKKKVIIFLDKDLSIDFLLLVIRLRVYLLTKFIVKCLCS